MNWGGMIGLLMGFLFGALILKRVLPQINRFALKFLFRRRYGRKGKSILFVYSDSSLWKEYVEENILPRLEPHAVVLNWSKRQEWKGQNRFETRVFENWAGADEFVPTAIVFSRTGKVQVFRLWPTSRDRKPGKAKPLPEARQALLAAVGK